MFGWLEELYRIRRANREAIRQEILESQVCQSCEVLKVELAKERREKEMLLSHILHPKSEELPVRNENPTPILPRHVPWTVKQQELEAQDRMQKERILKEFQERVKGPEKVMGVENG